MVGKIINFFRCKNMRWKWWLKERGAKVSVKNVERKFSIRIFLTIPENNVAKIATTLDKND